MSSSAADGPEAAHGRHNHHLRHQRGKHRIRSRWPFLGDVATMLTTVTVMSLIVKTFLIQAFFIPSGSMEPTLHGCTGCVADRVVVNKQTKHMGGVKRGDIVVFRDSDGWLRHFSSGAGQQSRAQTDLNVWLFLHGAERAEETRPAGRNQAPQTGTSADPTTPDSRSFSTSTTDRPRSASTSSVCSPTAGGGRSSRAGVAEKRGAGAG